MQIFTVRHHRWTGLYRLNEGRRSETSLMKHCTVANDELPEKVTKNGDMDNTS